MFICKIVSVNLRLIFTKKKFLVANDDISSQLISNVISNTLGSPTNLNAHHVIHVILVKLQGIERHESNKKMSPTEVYLESWQTSIM